MMTIGETFLLRRYIQRKVNPRAAKPGINWFKLSCKVVSTVKQQDEAFIHWDKLPKGIAGVKGDAYPTLNKRTDNEHPHH